MQAMKRWWVPGPAPVSGWGLGTAYRLVEQGRGTRAQPGFEGEER